MHADELHIDAALVAALIERSLPRFAGRPVREFGSSGSSNALYRLGDDLLVRLPRQPGGSATIAKEARWLPFVATALPVPTPEVVAVGEPDLGYPERWSVVRWLPGTVPPTPVRGRPGLALAGQLARLLTAMRDLPVPSDAAADPELRSYRGGPLADQDDAIRQYFAECRRLDLPLDLDAGLRLWSDALTRPYEPGPPAWLHGDLLAENLLVDDDGLAAVLDFGALAVGDPAVDLVVAWEVLDPGARSVLRVESGVDDATWLRGRAWALAIAVMTFPYYRDTMPARCRARLAMARAVLADV